MTQSSYSQCSKTNQHATAPYLEGPVQVVPDPIALKDLDDSAARLQKGCIGQVGCVHADEHPRGRHRAKLLLKRRRRIKLHYLHLASAQHMSMHMPSGALHLIVTCIQGAGSACHPTEDCLSKTCQMCQACSHNLKKFHAPGHTPSAG